MTFWEAVIGLEIHAQLWTNRKLFSNTKHGFFHSPNTLVSCFDMSIPGTLPILNNKCVKLGVLAAIALNCTVNINSEFDRKHYFYCDLPSGYQITQHRKPLAQNGHMNFFWIPTIDHTTKNLEKSFARIKQIHIEQDSGKSVHDIQRNLSLINLNRAGVGLIEIVTDCDFKTGNEAAGFVQELRDTLKDLKICNGEMSQGSLRVDANVSLRPVGSKILGEKSEVKNMNSLRGISNAIEYEIKRQTDILNSGGKVINETRYYDGENECTVSMRDKEVIQDYRYLPEPNLSVLKIPQHSNMNSNWSLELLENQLKTYTYPMIKKEVLMDKFGLTIDESLHLLNVSGLFEWMIEITENIDKSSIVDLERFYKLLGKRTIVHIFHNINKIQINDEKFKRKFIEFISLLANDVLASAYMEKAYQFVVDNTISDIEPLIHENNWTQINDVVFIENLVIECIQENSIKKSHRKRKEKHLIKFYIKQVLSKNNLVNYKLLNEIIIKKLNELI